MRKRIQLNKPYLLLSYDWERYGKWEDEEKNIKDRKDSLNGINAIVKVHKEENAPLTLFILGKLLEVPILKNKAIEIIKEFPQSQLNIQQHTYSHIKIKDNILRGKGANIKVIEEDLKKAKKLIENITNKKNIGLGSAQSFYNGLINEGERQEIIYNVGIRFIRSDGRGPGDTRPAPSFDEEGFYRCPYFYNETPDLLEIPAHGYSDNYIKGFSKEKPDYEWSIEKEIEEHLTFFDYAIENKSHFAPLIHEWSVARSDKNAEVIRALIRYAKEKGVEITTYESLNNIIRKTLR